jgi:hypothetical protein
LPEALGIVGVKHIGGDATGVALAFMYHRRLGAVLVVAAGDPFDIRTGRE